MTLSNLIELGVMAVIISAGTFLWRYLRRKLLNHEGFEGIISKNGRALSRLKLDIEEERKLLEEILKNNKS